MTEILLALVTFFTSAPGVGILGGIGSLGVAKYFENKLDKRKAKQEAARLEQEKQKQDQDYGSKFRDELREELKTLREELKKAEAEADEWRGKYYDFMQQFVTTKLELDTALAKIKQEAEGAQKTIGE